MTRRRRSRRKLPPMLEKLSEQYLEATELADRASQAFLNLHPDSQKGRDKKIHAAVDKALREVGVLEECNTELVLDTPAYHDVLEEIPGSAVEFSLTLWPVDEENRPRVLRAMRGIGLRHPIEDERGAVKYRIDLT